MTERKRKRGRFQFSLRSLLVFVLLVSIGLSWLGVRLERARRQREAVEAIEDAPGRVFYEPIRPKWSVIGVLPRWDSDSLAWHMFWTVEQAEFPYHTEFSDEDVKCLPKLPNLRCLTLPARNLTDSGLQHIAVLTNLERLYLHDTQVTPEGIDELQKALPHCEIKLKPTY